MKRKTPFKIDRIENGEIKNYEFTNKEDFTSKIIDWISSYVSDKEIKKHNDRDLTSYLGEMTKLYGKFLDHYNLTYNFVIFHSKVAIALRKIGLSPWEKNDTSTAS